MAVSKIAAIYNIWDSEEFLIRSMRTLRVDLFIVVWQEISNYGEHYNPVANIDLSEFSPVLIKYEPDLSKPPGWNERRKRNIGIQEAIKARCTHFLHCDADELHPDFEAAKEAYLLSGKDGSCMPMLTYFGNENLRFENPDNYFVPFIHRLNPGTVAGASPYPFYVDPTRRINTDSVVLLEQFMHHYSWVRNDIERKIRNSTARNNIERSSLLADYRNSAPGFFVPGFGQRLVMV